MKNNRRELSDQAVQDQARAYLDYSRRGHLTFAQWADSKDFAPADWMAVKAAWIALLDDHLFGE